MKYFLLSSAVALILLSACSGSKEQVQPIPPQAQKKEEVKPIEPEREFTYTERYYVKSATIGDPTEVIDALQAIRVIQLKPGSGEVLVISSFDKLNSALETWFGIEFPSFAPGIYDLAEATKFAFYRFYLGDERKRIDGQSCEGNLKIESNEKGELIGTINATITGATRSLDTGNTPARIAFSGSFRIKQVALEDTMIKTR